MERYSTSSQSTEMATPTASWDIQSTSGSTLCLWIPCGSSYRWRSFWMHGNICQQPRGKRTAQSHRRIRRTECVRVWGGQHYISVIMRLYQYEYQQSNSSLIFLFFLLGNFFSEKSKINHFHFCLYFFIIYMIRLNISLRCRWTQIYHPSH